MKALILSLIAITIIACDDNTSTKPEDIVLTDTTETKVDTLVTAEIIKTSNLDKIFGEWQVDRYYIEYDGIADTAAIANFNWQKLRFYNYEYFDIDFGEGYKKQIFQDAGYGLFLGTYVFNEIKLYSDNSLLISGTFSNDPQVSVKDSLFLSKIE